MGDTQDVDDAFLRLIEAEERENEEEKKRKQSSSNIKDQLSTRRAEQDNGKRTHDSDPAAVRPEGKRMRIAPSEQIGGAESAKDEEDEEVSLDNCCQMCLILTESLCNSWTTSKLTFLGTCNTLGRCHSLLYNPAG